MELKVPFVDSWLCNPATVMRHRPASEAGPHSAGDQNIQLAKFDRASDRDWCELVRDVVALANSGGGTITIACRLRRSAVGHGLSADDRPGGQRHRASAGPLHGRFVCRRPSACRRAARPSKSPSARPRCQSPLQAGHLHRSRTPVRTAAKFLPPARSTSATATRASPATPADMRSVLDRSLRQVRRRWLRGIRRVMSRPGEPARRPRAKATAAEHVAATLQPVRIVNDPNAPALQPQDVDRLYPWRQKDLVRELNAASATARSTATTSKPSAASISSTTGRTSCSTSKAPAAATARPSPIGSWNSNRTTPNSSGTHVPRTTTCCGSDGETRASSRARFSADYCGASRVSCSPPWPTADRRLRL